MGSSPSIAYVEDQESPSGNGLLSVMSEPIEAENFSMEKFWAALDSLIMTRDLLPFEKEYEKTKLADGTIVCVSTYGIPMAGDIKIYASNVVSPEKNEWVNYFYHNDSTMKKLTSTSTLKYHPSLRKFEYWSEEHSVRHHGPLIQNLVQEIVKAIGSAAEVAHDADAIVDKGEKSVISGALDDATVQADGFLEWSKNTVIEGGGVVQPDGTILEEKSSWFAANTVKKYSYDPLNDTVKTFDYGSDSSCAESSLVATTILKVHRNPFRFEAWAVSAKARRSGKDKKDLVEKVTKDVLAKIAPEES